MIVCMSRRICVDLYNEIAALRPAWHDAERRPGHDQGGYDRLGLRPADWQQHIRTKARREALAKRFENPNDPFKIVIVRDMWLTGFDAPSLHTMYVDKPMHGHGLMQAIARVNRVFNDKPGGLIVDYLGLAHELKAALATYTESGGTGRTALDQEEAVAAMLERYELCCGLFQGFNRSKWTTGTAQERPGLLPPAQDHILGQQNGKDRYLPAVRGQIAVLAVLLREDVLLRGRQKPEPLAGCRSSISTSRSRGTGRSIPRIFPASPRPPPPGRSRFALAAAFGISGQRRFKLVGESEIIHDQAAGLVPEDPVDAGDRLHQPVAAHRLVDVHRVQAAAHRSRSATCRAR